MNTELQNKHSCRTLLQKVMLSLDGEMSEEEERVFFDEVTKCSTCLEHYNIEKSFKEFLCAKIARKTISPDVIISIREKVLGASPK